MNEILASCGVSLFLDQWSKRMVQLHARNRCISWGPILQIRYVSGLSPIYTRAGARVALIVTWLVALVSSLVLHGSGAWFHGHIALAGLGLALGGAAGNLLDILRHRYVVDFIDLRWW